MCLCNLNRFHPHNVAEDSSFSVPWDQNAATKEHRRLKNRDEKAEKEKEKGKGKRWKKGRGKEKGKERNREGHMVTRLIKREKSKNFHGKNVAFLTPHFSQRIKDSVMMNEGKQPSMLGLDEVCVHFCLPWAKLSQNFWNSTCFHSSTRA